ncbi:golgin subfamily A member [Trifolium repens]|nr:golgin subfamily A member [Trifolium repens]
MEQSKLKYPNSPYSTEVSDSDHVFHSDKVPYFETILREKQDVMVGKQVEDTKERVEEKDKNVLMLKVLESFTSIKDSLSRVKEGLDLEGEKDETFDKEMVYMEQELGDESRVFLEEARLISRLAFEVETKVEKYKELVKKEKRELENSLISLTEENRDINNLLRVALLEKEALEKRIKGHDHKRKPLLQFAEFGLQKVGFGFMMGGGNSNEQSTDSASEGNKSDSSDYEVEVVSLASTVERIMKNLRLEIAQLRRSLEESRSDTERLQCLAEKQIKEIEENKLYIKELEDRERILTQKVEEFFIESKEAEEEVARWKEACELEVKAGKKEIEERDKMVAALKQELQKTKGALDISNGKLRLKEELAMTAIAAQEAAEKSLQLVDSRGVELRRRIEELTRQLEEAEKRERNSRKVRRICWPWQVFRLSSSNIADSRIGNSKRMLPEMQSFLQ